MATRIQELAEMAHECGTGARSILLEVDAEIKALMSHAESLASQAMQAESEKMHLQDGYSDIVRQLQKAENDLRVSQIARENGRKIIEAQDTELCRLKGERETKEYEVELYELCSQVYTVKAKSKEEAIEAVLEGQGECSDDGPEFIETADRYAGPDMPDGIRSVEES